MPGTRPSVPTANGMPSYNDGPDDMEMVCLILFK